MAISSPARLAEEFRGDILDLDTDAARRMTIAYQDAYREARARLETFTRRYEEARRAHDDRMMTGDLSTAERNKLAAEVMGAEFETRRWGEVASGIKTTMDQYAQVAEGITRDAQGNAINLGIRSMGRLIEGEMPDSMGYSFTRPDDGALRAMVGFTGPGSPLTSLFSRIAPEMMGLARETLQRGIALGTGPAVLARQLDGPLGIPLWRSLTIARTETLRAYRESQRETIAANADVLDGWVWRSARDRRTCEVCWANDGQSYPIKQEHDRAGAIKAAKVAVEAMGGYVTDPEGMTKTLEGVYLADGRTIPVVEVMETHVNCRCTMVPKAKSYADILGDPSLPDTRPDMGTGPDAFAKLDPALQRQILGPGKYALYQQGVPIEAMWQTSTSEWGTSRVAKPLWMLQQEVKDGRWTTTTDLGAGDPFAGLPPDVVAHLRARFNVESLYTGREFWPNLTLNGRFVGIEEATRLMQAAIDQAELSVRRSSRSAGMILIDGRFKTQFETGKSAGAFAPDQRASVEGSLFGYQTDLDPTNRPVYGYLWEGADRDGAEWYGDVRFVLKDTVRARTTVVFTDSLGTNLNASPATGVHHTSIDPRYWGFRQDDIPSGSPYIEAQIHGGLRAEDIDRIYIDTTENPEMKRNSRILKDYLRGTGEWVDWQGNGSEWRRRS